MKFLNNLIDQTDAINIEIATTNPGFEWIYRHQNLPNSFYKKDLEVLSQNEVEIIDYELAERVKLDFMQITPTIFTHEIFSDSSVKSDSVKFLSKVLSTFQSSIDIGSISLIKADLFMYIKDESDLIDNYTAPVVDSTNTLDENIYTLLYYVNSTDGDSVIFNELYSHDISNPEFTIKHRQTPERRCAILLEGDRYSAEIPSKNGNKILMRIVFESNEKISW